MRVGPRLGVALVFILVVAHHHAIEREHVKRNGDVQAGDARAQRAGKLDGAGGGPFGELGAVGGNQNVFEHRIPQIEIVRQ